MLFRRLFFYKEISEVMGVTILSDILDKNNSVKESETDYSGGVHYESDELFQSSDHRVKLDLPTNDNNEMLKLKSKDISEAIKGATVKTALIPADKKVELPNYTIDFTGVEQISQYQMRALDEILIDDYNNEEVLNQVGDGQSISDRIPIYVWANKDILKLGYGDFAIVCKVLPSLIQKVFGGQCKLYKDVIPGQPVKESKQTDIAALRMQI